MDSFIANVEKEAENTNPFAGVFGIAREDEQDKIFATVELKRVGDRVYTWVGGELDKTHPEGHEIIDEKYFLNKGNKQELLETGNIRMGAFGFIYIRQPDEKPFREFTTAQPFEYLAKKSLCIGKADKALPDGGTYAKFVKDVYKFQGKCAILAQDGSCLTEGYFKNGQLNGPVRHIKMSKRKPGCYTMREGTYQEGVESAPQRQTKVQGKKRIQTFVTIGDGSYAL